MPQFRGRGLGYPGGTPGFNTNHPASNNVQLSASVRGGNFVNILNGKQSTLTGTPVVSIDGMIGPSLAFSGTQVAVCTGPTTAPAAVTMAAIVRYPTAGTANYYCFLDNSNSNFGNA